MSADFQTPVNFLYLQIASLFQLMVNFVASLDVLSAMPTPVIIASYLAQLYSS